jgi:hypothetical protein
MSGLPKSGHDWPIYEYTPERDAARRSRQAPLHRLRVRDGFPDAGRCHTA